MQQLTKRNAQIYISIPEFNQHLTENKENLQFAFTDEFKQRLDLYKTQDDNVIVCIDRYYVFIEGNRDKTLPKWFHDTTPEKKEFKNEVNRIIRENLIRQMLKKGITYEKISDLFELKGTKSVKNVLDNGDDSFDLSIHALLFLHKRFNISPQTLLSGTDKAFKEPHLKQPQLNYSDKLVTQMILFISQHAKEDTDQTNELKSILKNINSLIAKSDLMQVSELLRRLNRSVENEGQLEDASDLFKKIVRSQSKAVTYAAIVNDLDNIKNRAKRERTKIRLKNSIKK